MKRKIYQAGISFLEVLMSLTIIAIILVMATRYFFVANNNDRINEARQQIGSVIAAAHGWKNQNPQYSADSNFLSTLYNDGFLAHSNSLTVSGKVPGAIAKMYDPWGAPISVTSSSNGVTITVSLPKHSDCVSLKNSYPEGSCTNQSGGFALKFV